MAERRRGVLGALVVGGLLCAVLGMQLQAQEAPAPAAPAVRWEYRLLSWTKEDAEAALRDATGDQLANVADMATALASEVDPVDHPKLQAAVNRRLQKKLDEAGAKGWELEWVRESTLIEAGYVLPAPNVFLKRRKR